MAGEGLGAKAQVSEMREVVSGVRVITILWAGCFSTGVSPQSQGICTLSCLSWMSKLRLRDAGYLESECVSQPLESKLGL